jgi:hypothetical protein
MNISQSVVVSAANRPMFGVGGESSYATHEYKGYVVSLEWDLSEGSTPEPVMLIWPALAWKESGVFGICLSSAGKYADPNGSPTKEGLYECGMALSLLGRAVLPIELNVLVDVVMRFIPDLILMPPAPKALRRAAKGQAYMDITQSDQYGRVISEVSI